MADDYNIEEEENEESVSSDSRNFVQKGFDAAKNSIANTTSKITKTATNGVSSLVAGTQALFQSTSITTMATSGGIIFGLLGSIFTGSVNLDSTIRDDALPPAQYECIDEYVDAYKAIFGTINTTPLAEQNNIVVMRLREINEWSKTYVGQKASSRLICNDSDCPWYGHEGCPDPDHTIQEVDKGYQGYYDLGGQIDLANVKRLHSFFREYGLTDVQIAAICGVATIESRIDFTSVEGYNIQGDRYNLDPSASTDKYAFKPWAEGIGDSPIETATCMHEITANTYSGPDQPIDYAAYSAEYPSIYKLGIGMIGFTDGPGFYNNTFLRNYADELDDKVKFIQRAVEGSKGWQDELRQRSADLFHLAYGGEGDDKRGMATKYEENVDLDILLFMDEAACKELIESQGDEWDERYDPDDGKLKSSGWLYKKYYEKYQEAEKALDEAVKEYEQKVQEYMDLLNQLLNTPWQYHSVTVNPNGDPDGAPLLDITFEGHKPEDLKKKTTSFSSESAKDKNPDIEAKYVDIFEPETLKQCEKSDEEEDFIEFRSDSSGPGSTTREQGEDANNIDVVYRVAEPTWSEAPKTPSKTVSPSGTSSAITVTQTVFPSSDAGLPGDINLGSGMTPVQNPNDHIWDYYITDMWGNVRFNDGRYNADLAAYQNWLKMQQAFQQQWAADNAAIANGQMPTPPTPPTMPDKNSFIISYDAYGNPIYDNAAYLAALRQYQQAMQMYNWMLQQHNADMNYFNNNMGGMFPASSAAIQAERAQIDALIAQLQQKAQEVQDAYDEMQQKKQEFFETLDDFNKWSKNHAHDVVRFYNALQDNYTAAEMDFEMMMRDATYDQYKVFEDIQFYTKAAFEYEFVDSVNQILKDKGEDYETTTFLDLFSDGDTDDDGVPDRDRDGDGVVDNDKDGDGKPDNKIDPKKIKLYYDLWQNYAKYATNLPQNGKYINWWLPEVQMLFLVGGSYDAETGKGLKVRDEYRSESSCSECGGQVPEYDTDSSKYFYDWMSTWKGEDYTGRDLTTATKNFYYDMVSGGFDDGTLTKRTEYAYAYYYMFQFDTAYQQTIQYASSGGQAEAIMREMINEGRWQTNMSNTLSDTAMPHNDKWKDYQTNKITRLWDIDTSTSMSTSMLSTLGVNQQHSRANLLGSIWNGCRYVNFINNSTPANSGMYLVDDPLIYDKNNKFTKMKYGDNVPDPVSNLAKTVVGCINVLLGREGKTSMGDDITSKNGFTFAKTCILWSGMDKEWENISDIDKLREYLEEATSSIWVEGADYQKDYDGDKGNTGRGNNRIWEQRRMGPYYDENGDVYWYYKWVLVPRVLGESKDAPDDADWYDTIRAEENGDGKGNTEEDTDKYKDGHEVDEHNVNDTPYVKLTDPRSYDEDGYYRKPNEDNERNADWQRVDLECWDPECEECHGKGGHVNTDLFVAGDIILTPDDKVYIWLGERVVQNMFPLEAQNTGEDAKVLAGGDEATKLKTFKETGLTWDTYKPCTDYKNHTEGCTNPDHNNGTKTPELPDPDSCQPYNPDGKWAVYRLMVSNYTDSYRQAGVIPDVSDKELWDVWAKNKWLGMEQNTDESWYLEFVRQELQDTVDSDYYDSDTEYPRDIERRP